MIKSTRDRRAMLRTRRRDNRPQLTERRRVALLKTTLHRPRSISTYLLAAGVPESSISAVAQGLRNAAERLHVVPAVRRPVARQIGTQGHRAPSRMTARWTRQQVLTLIPAYRPRKAEYKAAISQLSSALAA
jgi:hypothetical protein